MATLADLLRMGGSAGGGAVPPGTGGIKSPFGPFGPPGFAGGSGTQGVGTTRGTDPVTSPPVTGGPDPNPGLPKPGFDFRGFVKNPGTVFGQATQAMGTPMSPTDPNFAQSPQGLAQWQKLAQRTNMMNPAYGPMQMAGRGIINHGNQQVQNAQRMIDEGRASMQARPPGSPMATNQLNGDQMKQWVLNKYPTKAAFEENYRQTYGSLPPNYMDYYEKMYPGFSHYWD